MRMKRKLILVLTFCILVIILVCFKMLLSSAIDTRKLINNTGNNKNVINGSEYITDKNRNLIGTEIKETENNLKSNTDNKLDLIPYKNIINSTDEGMTLLPSSIDDFIVAEGDNQYITPEIIGVNGSLSLFTKKDGSGWKLNKGESLTFNFNKYESKSQTVSIGYVLNGKMIKGEKFKDLSGSYKITANDSGEYYIYILNLGSDYIAFKEGNIIIS